MSDGKVHSEIGASSAERWFNCSASVRLSYGIPNVSNAYADAGTRAHEVASSMLENKPHEFLSEEEMASVQVYVDYIQNLWKSLDRHEKSKIMIEHRFDLSSVHPGLFGTCDCAIYDGATKSLHVIDYKHGIGVPVSPDNNVQLQYYGLGALLSLQVPVEKVILTIVQPRYSLEDAVKSWETDGDNLITFAGDLASYARATEDNDSDPVPGDWCRFCRGRVVCPALKKNALLSLRKDLAIEKLKDLTPEVVGDLLSKLNQIENWISGVREFAYSEAKQGRTPEGFKLVAKRSSRKWINPEYAQKNLERALHSSTYNDLLTSPELKSPAQVERVLGKANKHLLNDLVVSVSSGDTLVDESDKRQEINPKDASDMFEAIE